MNHVVWQGDIRIGDRSLLVFFWRGRNSWRWPHIERLCTAGQGYDHSEWRYKIGPFDGKYRHGKPERTQTGRSP